MAFLWLQHVPHNSTLAYAGENDIWLDIFSEKENPVINNKTIKVEKVKRAANLLQFLIAIFLVNEKTM